MPTCLTLVISMGYVGCYNNEIYPFLSADVVPMSKGEPVLQEKAEEHVEEADAQKVTIAESKEPEPIKCIGGNLLFMVLMFILS